MTTVYITIDTEYSSGMANSASRLDRSENFMRSISCLTPDGPTGISHKLELLKRYGQKAVFFVDPMPAMQWGVAAIEDIVGPIIDAGQDVQLHIHTEWLELVGSRNPLGNRTGLSIKDFAFDDQCTLLSWARDTLIAAGAPAPVAFRAGNYGANDDTLRALAEIGIAYDTSFCPGITDSLCDISLGPEDNVPLHHKGVIEVPIGCIATLGGGLRHAQITALSLREMLAAIRYARDEQVANFTLVSHSFELINRRNLAVNKIVRRRFESLCSRLQKIRKVRTGDYRDDPPIVGIGAQETEPLPADALRSGMRMAEQLVANTLYGAS